MKYNELAFELEQNTDEDVDYSYKKRQDSYDFLLKNDQPCARFFADTLELVQGTSYDIVDLQNFIKVLKTSREER